MSTAYEHLLIETRDRVAIVTLHRPQRLNALSDALAAELACALRGFDDDPGIAVIVITGSEKAFAIGAKHARKETDEYAVMIDTRFPLEVAALPEGIENRDYVDSWTARPTR